MDRRTKNVEIFKDSVKLMNGSSRLQQAITESQNKQKLYLETEDVAVPESNFVVVLFTALSGFVAGGMYDASKTK